MPATIRRIRGVARLSHFAVGYIVETGKIQGIKVGIGFPAKSPPPKELAKRIDHVMEAMAVKPTLRWVGGDCRHN